MLLEQLDVHMQKKNMLKSSYTDLILYIKIISKQSREKFKMQNFKLKKNKENNCDLGFDDEFLDTTLESEIFLKNW